MELSIKTLHIPVKVGVKTKFKSLERLKKDG